MSKAYDRHVATVRRVQAMCIEISGLYPDLLEVLEMNENLSQHPKATEFKPDMARVSEAISHLVRAVGAIVGKPALEVMHNASVDANIFRSTKERSES